MSKSVLTHLIVIIVAVYAGFAVSKVMLSEKYKLNPSAKLVGASAALGGFEKFAADVEWMLLVNYLGNLRTVDSSNIKELTDRIEQLISHDPNFEKAYNIGVLSMSNEDPGKAIELLQKACDNEHFKNNWQFPFYAGFITVHDVKSKIDNMNLAIEEAEQNIKKEQSKKTPSLQKIEKYKEDIASCTKQRDAAEKLEDRSADFFRMAIERSPDGPENYVVNYYIRSQAKIFNKEQAMRTRSKLIDNDDLLILKFLKSEWDKEKRGSMNGASIIPNLQQRLLKASQDAKDNNLSNIKELRAEPKSADNDAKINKLIKDGEEIEKFIKSITNEVFADQHICLKCLSQYGPGDKFCSNCGTQIPQVYGICTKCGALLKGGNFCQNCGFKVPPRPEPGKAPLTKTPAPVPSPSKSK